VDWLGLSWLQPSVGVERHGERYRLWGRVRLEPAAALALAVQFQQGQGGGPRPEDFLREGHAALAVLYRPLPSLSVHGRASWREEERFEPSRRTRELSARMEVAWEAFPELRVRARYEHVRERVDSKGARTPPEPSRHLFRLELEGRLGGGAMDGD
jgi:hypothetical protein